MSLFSLSPVTAPPSNLYGDSSSNEQVPFYQMGGKGSGRKRTGPSSNESNQSELENNPLLQINPGDLKQEISPQVEISKSEVPKNDEMETQSFGNKAIEG